MKPNKILVKGKNYFAWDAYEEQTQIKHKVLKEYFYVYASKIGSWANPHFFDCHGGSGAYFANNTLSFGSSILAWEAANDPKIANRSTKVWISVCEKDKENYDNICKVITDNNITARINKYNLDFNEALQDPYVKAQYTFNPTLFLIDPFGFDLVMKNFKGLLQNMTNNTKECKGNELIINFMYNSINQWLSAPSVDRTFTDYFGGEEWKEAIHLKGEARESFLVSLYKRKLKEHTGAKFVFAYRLSMPTKDRTYYYLFHVCNHRDGLRCMKQIFASKNYGRVEYLGKKNDAIILWDLEEVKNDDIEKDLTRRYANANLSFDDLCDEIIEDTAYLEKEIRGVIKKMEKMGAVDIRRIDSVKSGVKGRDKINFKEGL